MKRIGTGQSDESFNYGDLNPFTPDPTIEAIRKSSTSAQQPDKKEIRQSAQRLLDRIEQHPSLVIRREIDALPEEPENMDSRRVLAELAYNTWTDIVQEVPGADLHKAHIQLAMRQKELKAIVRSSYNPFAKVQGLGENLASAYEKLEEIDTKFPRERIVREYAQRLQEGLTGAFAKYGATYRESVVEYPRLFITIGMLSCSNNGLTMNWKNAGH